MTPERYLQLQFIKGIRKGRLKNAEVSPQATDALLDCMFADEYCIVAVKDKQKRRLWFTNRRLLVEEGSKITTLFEYAAVQHVHWMFRDFWDRLRVGPLPEEQIAKTKMDHFDRLEVELKTDHAGLVTLEGLDQSYLPIFQFLQWLEQSRASS